MKIQTEKNFYTKECFQEFLKARKEPEGIKKRRQESFEVFCDLPWPDPNTMEEWRRTSIAHIPFLSYPLPSASKAASLSPPKEGYYLHFVGVHLVDQNLPSGVVCTPLSPFPSSLSEEFFTGRLISPKRGKLEAWHSAFWQQGVFFSLPKGVQLDQPVYVLWEGEEGAALFPYLVVHLEEGSQASFCLHAGGSPGLWLSRCEVFLSKGARLSLYELQTLGESSYGFFHSACEMKRDSYLRTSTAQCGGALVKTRFEGILAEKGSEIELFGAYFPVKRQKFTLVTLQHHRSPHTQSNLLYKGAVGDRAYAVYQGKIDVEEEATSVSAYQKNDNLLLSDDARADSIPALEIKNNELTCSHGATLSKIPEDQIFYLMSRGLSEEEAKALILEGFFPVFSDPYVERVWKEEYVKKMKIPRDWVDWS